MGAVPAVRQGRAELSGCLSVVWLGRVNPRAKLSRGPQKQALAWGFPSGTIFALEIFLFSFIFLYQWEVCTHWHLHHSRNRPGTVSSV